MPKVLARGILIIMQRVTQTCHAPSTGVVSSRVGYDDHICACQGYTGSPSYFPCTITTQVTIHPSTITRLLVPGKIAKNHPDKGFISPSRMIAPHLLIPHYSQRERVKTSIQTPAQTSHRPVQPPPEQLSVRVLGQQVSSRS